MIVPLRDWLPVDGGVQISGQCLVDFHFAGDTPIKGLLRGGQVLAAIALKAESGLGLGNRLKDPFGVLGGAVAPPGD